MAAILSVDSNLADFATISATGKKSTIGFGAWNRDQTKEAVKIFNNIIS
jgi:CRISPR/Cas system endoribonuclease Cas6 (RAMP superfamily)